MEIQEISVQALNDLLEAKADIKVLDVRRQNEYDFCNIKGHLIPLDQLPGRVGELNPTQKTVVHCRSGGRSKQAVQWLMDQGFTEVYNLKGGVLAWANEIDNTLPTY